MAFSGGHGETGSRLKDITDREESSSGAGSAITEASSLPPSVCVSVRVPVMLVPKEGGGTPRRGDALVLRLGVWGRRSSI